MARASMDEVRATYKTRDAWWTVLLVDPVAGQLVRLLSPYRWLTPNRLTAAAFVVGLGAAACLLDGGRWALVAGALLYHASFVIDCVDGKIARLRGDGTIFGVWIDFICDRLRVVLCTLALMWGQYQATGQARYLVVATVVVFLALFRYVHSAQIEAIEADIDARLRPVAARGGGPEAAPADAVAGSPAGAGTDAVAGTAEHAGMAELGRRMGALMGVRDWLVRHRIRGHLLSGIEFEMAVLVVAPLIGALVTGAIVVIPLVTGAILLGFEAAFAYRLWLAARSANRVLAASGSRS